MLSLQKKNPVTNKAFSTTYKALIKSWTKHPIHSKEFQGEFVISFSSPENSFVLGDGIAFVQLIKLVAHLTNYKSILWVVSSYHDEHVKQALLELDLNMDFKFIYGVDPVEAMSMKFDEGILLIYDDLWKFIHFRTKIKSVIVHERTSIVPTFLNPVKYKMKSSLDKIEWVSCENVFEKAQEVADENSENNSIQILVSNVNEQQKLEKLLRRKGLKHINVFLEAKRADITIDTGNTYCQEYHFLSRVFLQEKRCLYQDQLQDRASLTQEKFYLLVGAEKVLQRRLLPERPLYAEVLQLLSLHSAKKVNTLVTNIYSESVSKHVMKTLYYLDGINSHGNLTLGGRQMAELPIDPQISKMLIKYGDKIPCVFFLGAALHLSSELKDWFLGNSPHHKQWEDSLGDHLSLLGLIDDFCRIPEEEAPSWCLQHQVNLELLQQCRKKAHEFASRLGMTANSEKNVEVREAILDVYFLQTLLLHESKLWMLGYHKPILESDHVPADFPKCMVCSKLIVYKRSQIQLMGTPCTIQELKALNPDYFIPRRFTEPFQKLVVS